MSTKDNLGAAFAGEAQANRKYLAFSKKAEEENMPGVAKLFRAAAESETVHALNHLSVLGGVKSSKENLEVALEGETYEIEKMYPGFIEEAEKEGSRSAVTSFDRALKSEEGHQANFLESLEKVSQGEDIETKKYFVCQICGYTTSDTVPEICPICGALPEKFKEVTS